MIDLNTTFSLAGKVALVSGAARGIGAEIAKTLAAAGANVMVTDVLKTPAQAVVSAIRETGREATFQQLDVTLEDQWDAAVHATIERLGGLCVFGDRGEDGLVLHQELALPDRLAERSGELGACEGPVAQLGRIRAESAAAASLGGVGGGVGLWNIDESGYEDSAMSARVSAGYKFNDYLQFGAPLNILFWLLSSLLIPVFWPF